MTFTAVPPGTGYRAALDRDGDGIRDGDEIAAGTDPADPRDNAPPCTGDCNEDGEVTVDEIIVGVQIALGALELEQCAPFDFNADGSLTVEELVQAVNHALNACPS